MSLIEKIIYCIILGIAGLMVSGSVFIIGCFFYANIFY